MSTLKDRLREAIALKEVARAGWLRAGVSAPESVAAHSWGVAWLVLALCPPELDRGRALAMAILHDLGEVRTGDITPHDHVTRDDKHAAELAAVRAILAPLESAAELEAMWREVEGGQSAEARFVKACDKLDMALTARHYEASQAVNPDEFIASALARIDDETLRRLTVR